LNVISAYVPQIGLSDNVKRYFLENLEDMVRKVSSSQKFFIRGDFNGHVVTARWVFERIHDSFEYDKHNQEREQILNLAIAYDLMVGNTLFRKKKNLI
jgi:hypothetical protein